MKIVKEELRLIAYLFWKLKYIIDFNFICRYIQTIRFISNTKDIIQCDSYYKGLEVGSGDAGMSYFLPKYENVAVDISFGKNYILNQKQVIASSTNLPFKDNIFKFVVSVDTLEHLPSEHRSSAINEMLRVSNKYLILTAPISKLAEEYEDKILKLYKVKKRIIIPLWLIEHQRYGLPSEIEILDYFSKQDVKIIDILSAGNIKSWYIVNRSLYYGKLIYMLFNLFFTIGILISYRLIINPPYYRKTFIVEKYI